MDIEQNDLVQGKYGGTVSTDGKYLIIDGNRIVINQERDPSKVLTCTYIILCSFISDTFRYSVIICIHTDPMGTSRSSICSRMYRYISRSG